jgi:hypothetical protein
MSEFRHPSRPDPSPWGAAIAAACRQAGLSARAAARRAGISEGRWRQITGGYQVVRPGVYVPVRGPAQTVARMAAVAGLTPAQLTAAGRDDAARVLAAQGAREAARGQARGAGDWIGGDPADGSRTNRNWPSGNRTNGIWAGADSAGNSTAGGDSAGQGNGTNMGGGSIDELLLRRIRTMDSDRARELLAQIAAALLDSVAGEAGAGPGAARSGVPADEPRYGT